MKMTTMPSQNNESPWRDILRFFPSEYRELLAGVPVTLQQRAMEIRFRVNQPLELNLGRENVYLTPNGDPTGNERLARRIPADGCKRLIAALTAGSFYALEEEMAQGYLTMPGGHRVGFTGQAVLNGGRIRMIRNIMSINFRIARSVTGIARRILPDLWRNGRLLKTLIVAPPAAGKTTLLRDLIKELSNGVSALALPGLRVGVVDERSEIGGSYQGAPQFELGPRTDLLDNCMKRDGVYLLLRTMNPQVIAMDEIGTHEDFAMLEDIVNAGVGIVATAHARNRDEALNRPGLKRILEGGMIERLVVLSTRNGAGTVEAIEKVSLGSEIPE